MIKSSTYRSSSRQGNGLSNGVHSVVQSSSTTRTSSSAHDDDQGPNGLGVAVKDSRSFLQDRSKVSGFGDVMGRMAATDAVEGEVESEEQARSLLNRFLGAQVLLTGVESMMAGQSNGNGRDMESSNNEERTVTTTTTKVSSSSNSELVRGVDIDSVFDEDKLRKLLDSCDAYEDRRKVRQRLKTISANAKGVSGSGVGSSQGVSKRGGARDSSGVSSSSSSALRSSHGPRTSNQASTQKSSYTSSFSTQSSTTAKGVSPFNKFQQLDSQHQTTRRASGSGGAGGPGSGQLFALSSSLKSSANSIKDVMLQWCQCRTRGYKGIKIENFSTSWNDGMAFCALIHHFYPDAFDFDQLNPKNRRYNFDLAFKTADDRAGVMALLDVEDMVVMKKPDWKCVFTYIQSLYKRLKDE